MGVIKFDRDFETLFNWDTDDNPTTEQDYQNAVKNWTETEKNIVDTLLWQPTTEYATGNIVKTPSLPSQYVLRCAEAGTSGSTEPSYSGASAGDTVTDGSVEWVIVSLATGNAADVDASNIGVNAEVDNSEAWASAIGGGAIAEDDGRLVKGDTVHAVTSVMETNIATNTEAIEENAENIATNTGNIAQNTTDIDIAEKRIGNIEKLLQGNLYDYDTDTDSAYTKTVPQGAMPYASLEQIGGRTLVWNQLVDSGTTTVATISGHKYYTSIDGTASIVTSSGSAITIVDDTADMVTDLTLCYGAGNEPSTVAEFTAQFPANYYPYSQGQLLSAGVTEVVSVGKNLAYYGDGLGVPSDTTLSDATKRFFPRDKYFIGMTPTNYYDASRITSYNVTNDVVSVSNINALYGFSVAMDCVAGKSYTLNLVKDSSSADIRVALTWYGEDGTMLGRNVVVGSSVTDTAPSGAKTCLGGVYPSTNNSTIKFSNFQIEVGSTATTYVPAKAPIQYPIPAEIQALEGYGWSAGSVYNYIDYERKVFVKCVDRVDLGTLTWSWQSAHGVFSSNPGAVDNTKTMINVPNGIVCQNYTFMGAYSNLTDKAIGYIYNKNFAVKDDSFSGDAVAFKTAMNGVYACYPLATPQEIDISAYITDDNLIEVEAGGTLTFPNSNGDDYRIPIPSSETYMVDLQASL